jgi:predicted DNA-binding transcriptional regulator AlpA
MTKHERPQPKAGGAVGDARQDHPTLPDQPDQAPIEPFAERQPEVAIRPIGRHKLVDALAELTAILPRLADALDRQSDNRPRVELLAYRINEVAAALGVSRRVLDRERAAGRLPKPDLYVGRMPLWSVATIRDWLERSGRSNKETSRSKSLDSQLRGATRPGAGCTGAFDFPP